MSFTPQVTSLSNNLRIITDTMAFESAVVMVMVKTGSRNENEINNGISHFLEHMAFKGTLKRSSFQISEEIDYIGGEMNAYTSKEVTAYYIKVLRKDIELAIEILADIIQNSTFDAKELEIERGVILQELAMSQDTPDDIIFDYFSETAYKGETIGYPIIGSKKNIESLQRDNFVNYMKEFYYGGNMALGVCGNIEHEKVVEICEKYFSILPSGVKQIDYKKCNYQGGLFFEVKKNLEQAQFVLGFKGFSYNQDEYYYSQSILSDILGSGTSSRLYQEVREKRGLAYSISSYSNCYYDNGMLGIYAAVSPANIEELVKVCVEEIKRLDYSLTEKELEKVKNQYKASILMSSESSRGRTQKAVSNYTLFNRYITSEEKVENINQVTLASLKDVLARIITGGLPTLALYGNIDNAQNHYDYICSNIK